MLIEKLLHQSSSFFHMFEVFFSSLYENKGLIFKHFYNQISALLQKYEFIFSIFRLQIKKLADLFHVTGLFPHSIKISGNLWFSDIFRKYKLRSSKCPYSEFFWSVFPHIRTKYGVSLRMQYKCGKTRTSKSPNKGTFHAVLEREQQHEMG